MQRKFLYLNAALKDFSSYQSATRVADTQKLTEIFSTADALTLVPLALQIAEKYMLY